MTNYTFNLCNFNFSKVTMYFICSELIVKTPFPFRLSDFHQAERSLIRKCDSQLTAHRKNCLWFPALEIDNKYLIDYLGSVGFCFTPLINI